VSERLYKKTGDGTERVESSEISMFWKDRSIMVTGAGGFIASHLVETLLRFGARVRAFVRYNSRQDIGLLRLLPSELLSECEIVFGDLRDVEAVDQACAGIDTVFHLGALISIPYSYLHPREVVETNISGTLNVLLGSQRHGIKKVVHTSSSEVYGTALYAPINESHPLQGQSPYSASKIGADKLAQSFHYAYNVPVATIRPFNTYGPRQSARAVIPTIITQALTKDEIYLGSLEPRRDFTFVEDTVDAFLRVAATPQAAAQEINVGSNADIAVGELAQKIIELTGRDVRIVCDAERVRPERSEVGQLWADSTKAEEVLGWKPRVSLDQGLQRTIDWIQAHLELYRVGQYEV
jgi:NAD dependent epimerase/dehydratase